jgi:hypothetical protein
MENFELNKVKLEQLAKDVESIFKKSCFQKVILVDAMAPFDLNPNELTYTLFSENSKHHRYIKNNNQGLA